MTYLLQVMRLKWTVDTRPNLRAGTETRAQKSRRSVFPCFDKATGRHPSAELTLIGPEKWKIGNLSVAPLLRQPCRNWSSLALG